MTPCNCLSCVWFILCPAVGGVADKQKLHNHFPQHDIDIELKWNPPKDWLRMERKAAENWPTHGLHCYPRQRRTHADLLGSVGSPDAVCVKRWAKRMRVQLHIKTLIVVSAWRSSLKVFQGSLNHNALAFLAIFMNNRTVFTSFHQINVPLRRQACLTFEMRITKLIKSICGFVMDIKALDCGHEVS